MSCCANSNAFAGQPLEAQAAPQTMRQVVINAGASLTMGDITYTAGQATLVSELLAAALVAQGTANYVA